jgi:uncharacterized protein (TIGR02001 family)
VRLLLAFALLLEPWAVVAGDVAGSVGVLSDYRFRGVSLTNRNPAVQAAIAYDDSPGWFAGALASNVNIDPNGVGLSVQAYGGYAGTLRDGVSADAGAVHYTFPHTAGAPSSDYTEAFAGVAAEGVGARIYLTNSYFGSGARGAYVDLLGSRELTSEVALTAHLGWLVTGSASSPSSEYSRARQLDFAGGIAGRYLGFHLELSLVGTASRSNVCAGGSSRCAPGVVFAVLRDF